MKKLFLLAIILSTILLLVDWWIGGNLLASFSLPSTVLMYLIFTSLPGATDGGFLNPNYPGAPWTTIGYYVASIPYFTMVFWLISRWRNRQKKRKNQW